MDLDKIRELEQKIERIPNWRASWVWLQVNCAFNDKLRNILDEIV